MLASISVSYVSLMRHAPSILGQTPRRRHSPDEACWPILVAGPIRRRLAGSGFRRAFRSSIEVCFERHTAGVALTLDSSRHIPIEVLNLKMGTRQPPWAS